MPAAILSAQYAAVFDHLDLPIELAVHEPYPGARDSVRIGAVAHGGGQGAYTAVARNRWFCAEPRAKISRLASAVRVIADDGRRAGNHVAAGSVDVPCFRNSIDNILHAVVAEEHVDHGLADLGAATVRTDRR